MIHPGRDEFSPLEIIKILISAGADPSRTVMSHIDRTIFTYENIRALAKMGTIIEFDLFGLETSFCELLNFRYFNLQNITDSILPQIN